MKPMVDYIGRRYVVVAPNYEQIRQWCRNRGVPIWDVIPITRARSLAKIKGRRLDSHDAPEVVILGWHHVDGSEVYDTLVLRGWKEPT